MDRSGSYGQAPLILPLKRSGEFGNHLKRKTANDVLYERELPSNVEAERCILGAIIIDNALCAQANDCLRPYELFLDSSRKIYKAMLSLYSVGDPIDLITLTEVLRTKGEFADVGGATYIASLIDGVPKTDNISHYVRIVKAKAMLRALARICSESLLAVLEEQESGDVLAGRIIERLQSVITAYTEVNLIDDP